MMAWLSAGLARRPIRLIDRGYHHPSLSVPRAMSAGARSWARNSAGAWVAYGQDTPRFGSDGGLLNEPQGGNLVRNPEGNGGTVGVSPNPEFWQLFAGSGLDTTLAARGTLPDGRPYVDLWIRGTTTNTFYVFALDGVGNAPVTPGATYTLTAGLALAAGSLANVSQIFLNLRWENGGAEAGVSPSGTVTDYRVTGASPPGNTIAFPSLTFVFAIGAVIDVTIRVVLPQLELGTVTTSRVTPASGAVGATLRGQDFPSLPLGALPSIAGGFCLVGVWNLIDLLGTSTQVLMQVDTGDYDNRVCIEKAGPNFLGLLAVNAGVGVSAAAGTAIAGTPQRWAIYGDTTGKVRARVGAGAPVEAIGAPLPSTYTTLRFGLGGFAPLATYPYLGLVPRPVTDAEALGLMNSLPV